jgi:hypothetical protein
MNSVRCESGMIVLRCADGAESRFREAGPMEGARSDDADVQVYLGGRARLARALWEVAFPDPLPAMLCVELPADVHDISAVASHWCCYRRFVRADAIGAGTPNL